MLFFDFVQLSELPVATEAEIKGTNYIYVVVEIEGEKIGKKMTLDQLKKWLDSE